MNEYDSASYRNLWGLESYNSWDIDFLMRNGFYGMQEALRTSIHD